MEIALNLELNSKKRKAAETLRESPATKNVRISPVFTMSDNFEFQEISPSAFFNLDEPATRTEIEEQAQQIHLPIGLMLNEQGINEILVSINYAKQWGVLFQPNYQHAMGNANTLGNKKNSK